MRGLRKAVQEPLERIVLQQIIEPLARLPRRVLQAMVH